MHTYKYPRPMVTVDVAIFFEGAHNLEILLVRRSKSPFRGKLALPGGFVNMDEDLVDAAVRELKEETGLGGIHLEQVGAFGKPGRDPRGRNIAVAFFGLIGADKPKPVAGDDAVEALFVPVSKSLKLAFDHDEILRCAVERLKNV